MNLHVVETVDEAKRLLEINKKNWLVAVPVFVDERAHPAVNPLSVLFLTTPFEIFVFGFDHNETPKLPYSLLTDIDKSLELLNAPFEYNADGAYTSEALYSLMVPNKKEWMYIFSSYKGVVDSQIIEFYKTGSATGQRMLYPRVMGDMAGMYRQLRNIYKSVPLMTLVEYVERFIKHAEDLYKNVNFNMLWYKYIMIPTFQQIEKNGLRVNPEKFKEWFGEKASKNIINGYVYTQYNPFNITGRPSNSFGGVNYAALPKDGSREAFISRFENGSLIEADFESFHLRLIADIIKYPQPEEPFHEYLGKLYSGVAHLTQEQYEEGKRTTFAYLYGERRPVSPIDFFEKVYNWVDNFWQDAQFEGYFVTPLANRKIYIDWIEKPTQQKVFSYLVQAWESEVAVAAIKNLMKLFRRYDMKSRIVLYTYDSVLIDYTPEDDKQKVIDCIKRSLGRRYPIRLKEGTDYKNMNIIGD